MSLSKFMLWLRRYGDPLKLVTLLLFGFPSMSKTRATSCKEAPMSPRLSEVWQTCRRCRRRWRRLAKGGLLVDGFAVASGN